MKKYFIEIILILILIICLILKKNIFFLKKFSKQTYNKNEKILRDQKELLKMLEVTHTIFENNNIWYIIYYGTLLGAVRHWGFIPWDNDIDLICTMNQKEHILTLNKEFKKFGYELKTNWSIIRIKPIHSPGPNIDIFIFDDVDGTAVRCMADANKINKHKRFTYNWETSNENKCNYLKNIWWSNPTILNSGWANNSFVGSLNEIQRIKYSFEGLDVYGPEEPLRILEGLYGSNSLSMCKVGHVHETDENGDTKIINKGTEEVYDCRDLPLQI